MAIFATRDRGRYGFKMRIPYLQKEAITRAARLGGGLGAIRQYLPDFPGRSLGVIGPYRRAISAGEFPHMGNLRDAKLDCEMCPLARNLYRRLGAVRRVAKICGGAVATPHLPGYYGSVVVGNGPMSPGPFRRKGILASPRLGVNHERDAKWARCGEALDFRPASSQLANLTKFGP